MRIAQISPLYESVPPKLYGGTERVVSYLTEALLDLGHEVTLFASGDSVTRARLIDIVPRALRLEYGIDDHAAHVLQLQRVVGMAGKFDIIHFHTDYFHFPVSRLSGYTHVTTLHGRLDLPELSSLYEEFNDIPVISISQAQRTPLPYARWVGNVYHGIPQHQYKAGSGRGEYAVFIGRMSPEKRVDRAIEIAGKAGIPIKIAAKINKSEEEYFEWKIRPLLSQPHVEFLGEVTDFEKQDLIGNATVMLFPIDWPEPFGMVLIEALACGTPVIAHAFGSVSEIIEHGKTGFIVSSVDEAVEAVKQIGRIDRSYCRHAFLNRFQSSRMAENYEAIYQLLIEEGKQQIRLPAKEKLGDLEKNVLSA